MSSEEQEDILATPLHGLIIPAFLLIIGVAIAKPNWTLYGILLTAFLVAFKLWRGRTIAVLNPEKFNSFELVDKVPVSANTNIYRFALPKSTDSLGLPIGQHISIRGTIDGKEYTRSYTPISSNEDLGYFELLVKHYSQGHISKLLNGLQMHQTIKVKGPKGRMHYRPNIVKKIGMIAGGTGITPMLQILGAIVKVPTDLTEVSLIFANVSEEDILLKEDIDVLAEKYPNFKVHYVLNEAGANWSGSVGFVTPEIIRAHLPAPSDDVKILICGPPPMISAMKKATVECGYEKSRAVSEMSDQVFIF